jgi:3-dehydroquinate synthetase
MKIINKTNNIQITDFDLDILKFIKQNFNKSDIMIIDKSLIKLSLIKKIIKIGSGRTIIIVGEEGIKSLDQYGKIIENILKKGINRNSKIFSLGGGTIGDLAGFVSSTLLRGIKHIMIPTTLLAMVDSSIGGKNGINSIIGKNLIGNFQLPDAIIINTNFLKSLPKREISCGFAEIIKYAFIHNKKLKDLLVNKTTYEIKKKFLKDIIIESILTKLKYTKDFRERKTGRYSRAILNYGHTFGHAIESMNSFKGNVKHGEAVAMGMIFEMKVSSALNLKPNSIDDLNNMLRKFDLPVDYKKYIHKNNILKIIKKISSDKKSFNEDTNLILIKSNTGIVKKISLVKLSELSLKLVT